MKICIITLSLRNNYGCLLQAFALQRTLRDMGHDVLTADYWNTKISWKMRLACNPFVRIIRKFLFGKKITIFYRDAHKCGIDSEIRRFVRENIKTTDYIKAPAVYADFQKYRFDAYVVGSDQIWRNSMAQYLPTSFLDFLPDEEKSIRIAYAASFGVDSFSSGKFSMDYFAGLARKFVAVSVREDSGVDICAKSFGVKAEHVLDPTMLVPSCCYENIIESDIKGGYIVKPEKPFSFAYILNTKLATEKDIFVQLKMAFGAIETINPKEDFNKIFPNWELAKLRPVSEWLMKIKYSDFVITDSFHGAVFSIIFKKPFAIIKNEHTGIARIESLLKMFSLENRISDSPDVSEIIKVKDIPINWEKVDEILSIRRIESKKFLENLRQ